MHLWINDSPANSADITRGVLAAQAVFKRYGTKPEAILDNPHDDLQRKAWIEADKAAIEACHRGWSATPDSAFLALV